MTTTDTIKASDLRAKLLVIGPGGQRHDRVLNQGESVILGRSGSVDIPLEDRFISRRHLKLRYGTDGVIAMDLSSNGTFAGESRLPHGIQVRLPWGKLLRIGRTTVSIELEGVESTLRIGQAADPPPLPRDEFQLLGVLGVGGSGRVWAAYDHKRFRVVAIKELRTEQHQDPEDIQRFQREASVGMRLRSPFIVDLLECRVAGDRPLMVMEYVPGPSLEAYLGQGPVDVAEALRIAEDIAGALMALFELGVVHRDIKPGNILLSAEGVAKLVDFGIAKVFDGRNLTQTGFSMGSLPYLAPEQARSAKDVTHLTDIYSLGATLFAMLSGRAPFLFEGVRGVMHRLMIVAREQPPELGELREDCPPEVAALVHLTLEKSPSDRPQTARELRDELRSLRERLYPAYSTQGQEKDETARG